MTKPRDLATLGGGFIQTGTGAIKRTVDSKLKDVVSVKDFGAVGDGVADDTATTSTAAAAAGNVVFSPGTYNLATTPTFSGPKVFEQQIGATITGAGSNNLGFDSTGATEYQLLQRNTTGADLALNYTRRIANHAGGTPGWVSTAQLVRTDVTNASAANYEWAFLSILSNYATAGENVAVYGLSLKQSTGPTWGGVFEAKELTNNPNGSGLIGIEVDVFANGTDNSNNRVGVDVVVGQGVPGTGNQACYAYAAFRANGRNVVGDVGVFKNGLVINSATEAGILLDYSGPTSVGLRTTSAASMAVGIDLSQGTFSTAAIRLNLASSSIAFEDTSTLKMIIPPTSNVLALTNAGTERVGFNMAAGTPGIRVNATQVIGPRITGWGINSGTQTRTGFDTAAVTLSGLAERVHALIIDLKTHGLISV